MIEFQNAVLESKIMISLAAYNMSLIYSHSSSMIVHTLIINGRLLESLDEVDAAMHFYSFASTSM
jgi:hypothetical protein